VRVGTGDNQFLLAEQRSVDYNVKIICDLYRLVNRRTERRLKTNYGRFTKSRPVGSTLTDTGEELSNSSLVGKSLGETFVASWGKLNVALHS